MHDDKPQKKMPSRKGIPQVRLKRSEAFQVMRVIDREWKTLKTLTTAEGVELIATEAKVPVTAPIVRSLIKDMEREVPFRRETGASSRSERTRFIANQVLILANEVEKLCDRLDEQFNTEGRFRHDALRGIVRSGEYYKDFKTACAEFEAELEGGDENE
jgi:hypothetical protein